MSKRVLMVGFHFPPSSLSSGHLRMLGFAKYLPGFGWEPLVLSATQGAYEQVDMASVRSIPATCRVYRAPALDVKRHLGIRGRYPSFLAQPDRWVSWWPAAVWRGLHLIRRHRVSAIWSTYPIMTSHCVAHTLHRLTGLPWVADFRDPVSVSVAGQVDGIIRSQMRWEHRVVSHAARTVFTTPGAMQLYAEQYPGLARQGRLVVIENGYDEDSFAGLVTGCRTPAGTPIVLVHSGVLYPEGRNPLPFLTALARLRAAGEIAADTLQVVLRASGSEAIYARELQRLGLQDIVDLAPSVSNREALAEQAMADGLLLFQGAPYDRQIPAKAYEYLRTGRPIFALVGERGDTAALLRRTGGAELAPSDDTDAIENGLRKFLGDVRAGEASPARSEAVALCSRRTGASTLARVLDQLAGRAIVDAA